MELKEKLNLTTVLLLILTAILHFVPLMDLNDQTLMLAGAALIYGPLGILLYLKPEIKVVKIIALIAPIAGLIAGIGMLITFSVELGNFAGFLFFLLVLDVIIIPIRFYILKIE
ncbi:MAG: hypothetical protein GY870_00760 [archaeon]|nr:hypothetical protein [archaeon]